MVELTKPINFLYPVNDVASPLPLQKPFESLPIPAHNLFKPAMSAGQSDSHWKS